VAESGHRSMLALVWRD